MGFVLPSCCRLLCLLLILAAGPLAAQVRLGIDELEAQNFEALQGKRVGLVMNPASVNSAGTSTLDVIRGGKGFELVSLFGPEHGIYGDIPAGDYVPTFRDKRTGLTAHSLYGKTRKPSAQMLKDLDAVVFDMQDIGARSYTFISTLGLLMQAASENGKEVIVLDRPNPLGGLRIEGAGVEPGFQSFVSQFDIPYVHGMTVGELAQWMNVHFLSTPCRLTVIPMKGWKRHMKWEETGLKWTPTSPNIPKASTCRHYVATGLLGEAGLVNGANQQFPFEVVAGPDYNTEALHRRLSRLNLPGVRFEPIEYVSDRKATKGQSFRGVRLWIDKDTPANLTLLQFQLLDALRDVHPGKKFLPTQFPEKPLMVDKVMGSDKDRRAWLRREPAEQIAAHWTSFAEEWASVRRPFLLYPE